jgi:hypothetical protein
MSALETLPTCGRAERYPSISAQSAPNRIGTVETLTSMALAAARFNEYDNEHETGSMRSSTTTAIGEVSG